MDPTRDLLGSSTGPDGGRSTTRLGSASEHTLTKLRIRWYWVFVLVLLGAAAGFLLSRGAVTYQAVAEVQVSVDTQDSNRIKQVAQTAERAASTEAVIDQAARARGTGSAQLAARMTAEWDVDTDVVNIVVRGDDPLGVVLDANAVAASLRDSYERSTKSQFQQMGAQGNELLSSGRLSDRDAEAARREGVGAAVAARQGSAAYGATTITPLDPAKSAEATSLSTPVGIVLGGFAGGALAAVAVILLPFRRFTITRASDIPALLPGVRGISSPDNGAAEIAGLFLESERADLAVVTLDNAEKAASSFAADVLALLQAHGMSAHLREADLEATATPAKVPAVKGDPSPGPVKRRNYGNLASFSFLGRSGRAAARKQLGADALVLVTPAGREPLAMLSGQTSVFAVVIVLAGRTQVRELQSIVRQLRHSDPTVVLVS